MEVNDELWDAIVFGERDVVIEIVEELVKDNVDVVGLLNTTMIPALREVGNQFSRNEVFIPEMLVAAKAMQGGMDIIEPLLVQSGREPVARVCIGSVKGDLHDIGKNLVAMMVEGAGFEINDLGTDVAPESFVQAIRDGASVVGLSALLTTTMPMISETIKAIEAAGLRDQAKIMVGGAPVTAEYAEQIGADGYAPDASQAGRLAKSFIA